MEFKAVWVGRDPKDPHIPPPGMGRHPVTIPAPHLRSLWNTGYLWWGQSSPELNTAVNINSPAPRMGLSASLLPGKPWEEGRSRNSVLRNPGKHPQHTQAKGEGVSSAKLPIRNAHPVNFSPNMLHLLKIYWNSTFSPKQPFFNWHSKKITGKFKVT